MKVSATSATSRPAASCTGPSRSRGADRRRSRAWVSASTARQNPAHASQLISRTAARNTVPLSRCSRPLAS
ncbi:MAG TPA: hypothetical protein DEH11_15050 [Actinobacteria bacterium]|nr:hypothetical protein [Actinomycetota bacterium]